MLFGVHELAVKLRQAGAGAIGFLYYTGHGVSVGVDNVLVPKNARNTSDAELNVRGVKLGEVLDILKREAPEAVHFVVLDACRNSIRGKKGAKGFVAVSDQRMGVVLAFATAAGETASDEGTSSGPYAAALAEEIVKPGHNDQTVFNAVRARVVAATRGQTPWTHDGLVGERIVFKVAAAGPGIGQSPGIAAPGGAIEIVRICREVESMTSLSLLGVLERQHTGTPAADCISARIGELKAAQAAADTAARKRADDETRAKAEAERQRLALLQQEEERKRVEAAKQAAEAASKRKADDEARAKAEAERQRIAMLARDPAIALLQNTEIVGSTRTFLGEQRDPDACLKQCLASASCHAFSFNTANSFCYLIDGILSQQAHASYVSGMRRSTAREHDISRSGVSHEAQYSIIENVEILGSTRTFSGERPTLDACSKQCLADPSCEAFSFNRSNRFCYLIDGVKSLNSNPSFASGRVR